MRNPVFERFPLLQNILLQKVLTQAARCPDSSVSFVNTQSTTENEDASVFDIEYLPTQKVKHFLKHAYYKIIMPANIFYFNILVII